MSRYANRLAPPSRVRASQGDSYYGSESPRLANGYYGAPPDNNENDDDDETAVATDLSLSHRQQAARRGVQFGENEIEEFNGSEAPDAVLPARSRSRMALSPPPHPAPARTDGRRVVQPNAEPHAPPPLRQSVAHRRLEMPAPPMPHRGRYDLPVSFARSTGGPEGPPRWAREGGDPGWTSGLEDEDWFFQDHRDGVEDDDDDDDAFTAVATGVATDLDFDEGPVLPNRRAGEDPRARLAAATAISQPLTQPHFLAVPRPPSRGVQVRRSTPVPPQPAPHGWDGHPPPRFSPSGFAEDDFSSSGAPNEDDGPSSYVSGPPPGWRPRSGSQQQQQQQQQQLRLPPPPIAPHQRTYVSNSAGGIGRPVSSTSSRMRVDDDEQDVAPHSKTMAAPGPSGRAAVAYQRPPVAADRTRSVDDQGPEDSPLERELIALLKELNFSLALKDFHDAMHIGVQKTLVSEDGMGHAYVKIHVQRLPKVQDLEREAYLKAHWVPLAGSRWEFRTASHSVTVVFKTTALAAYEAQFLTARR